MSDTVMEQHPTRTEESQDQQEECNREKAKRVHNINRKIAQDIDSLSPLSENPCIFKVHESLRKSNHEAYTPKVVSIGPYHHGNLKFATMEVNKRRYLNSILKYTNQVNAEPFLEAMMELEDRARNYYANPIDLNPDEFVEMMLLDGCFVVELICTCFQKASLGFMEVDPILRESWMVTSAFTDLMLLENQLPLFVLVKLYDMIHTPNSSFPPFEELATVSLISRSIPISDYSTRTNIWSARESKHLLDYLYKLCVPSSTGCESPIMSSHCSKIPCVTELQEAGVKFRVQEGHHSIFDISFEGGQMNIPMIDVGELTERVFRNMIAYEQYSSDLKPKYFIDYTYFMHLLINSGKDVNQLCRNNIFDYKVGNDEGVALMFNKLGEGRVFDTTSFYLSKLCKNVNAHCDQTGNKLKAILKRDYFYTPWAGVSTVAAAFLILLTVIQTVAALITLLA